MLIEKAKIISKKILSELNDRSGFDGWWDGIDADIQKEIHESIAKIVLQETTNEHVSNA